ncbi:MAG: replication-relaxation family protein, partial [Chloroflexota bacterium]
MTEGALALVAALEFVPPVAIAFMARLSMGRALEVLEDLRQAKLVNRTLFPAATGDGGQWTYYLTAPGARAASEVMREAIRPPRADERATLLLAHRLAVSQACASLAA